MQIFNPKPLVFLSAGLSLIAIQLLSLLNITPGAVGHDYVFFLPRLLEGLVFFRAQGLSLPLYSSFFCGGFPYHADPQVMFYSFPQLLTLVFTPWTAVQVTAVSYLFLGGGFAYLVCRRIFNWDSAISLFVAFTFAANGFSRARLLIGHLTYHPYYLLPVGVLFLLDKNIKNKLAVIMLGLLGALIIQGGGNYNAPIMGISLVLVTLFSLYLKTKNICSSPQILMRAFLGLVLTTMLCSSKLVSAINFTSRHPRLMSFDTLNNPFQAFELLISQLFIPGQRMPFNWGLWEYDSSLSLLVGLGIIVAFYFLLRKLFTVICKENETLDLSQTICGVSLALLLFVTLSFSSGILPGIKYLESLPFIQQMRVNIRFTSAVMFPLILIAAWGFNKLKLSHYTILFSLTSLLLSLVPGELVRAKAAGYMNFSIQGMSEFHNTLKTMPPYEIRINKVSSPSDNDWQKLINWQTNPNCYSVLFAHPPTNRLKEGPVDTIHEGRFNFLNPSCYVYPKENNCKAGYRILEHDRENFDKLLTHRNPDWKISRTQQIADIITLISVSVTLLALIFYLLGWLRSMFN